MNHSFVSVCVLTPIYAEPDHLILASFDSHTSSDILPTEYCLIDDNPTVLRVNLVKKIHVLCTQLGINFLYIENELNIGLTRSLNKALPLISSEYILRCDADDLSLNNRLQRQYFYMESHRCFSLSGPVVYSFNRPYTNLGPNLKFHYSLFGQPYPHSSWFVRSFLRCYFYPDIPVAQDYALIIILLQNGHSITSLSEIPSP